MPLFRLALLTIAAVAWAIAYRSDLYWLTGLGMGLALTSLWLPRLVSGGWPVRASWLAGLIPITWLGARQWLTESLHMLAIAAQLGLAWIFLSTLLPGREPLVTAIGEASRGPLDSAMRAYTRGVTLFWGGYLVLASACTLFQLFNAKLVDNRLLSSAPLVLAGVLFIVEYLLRRWKFPHHNHPAFIPYLLIVAHAMARRPSQQGTSALSTVSTKGKSP